MKLMTVVLQASVICGGSVEASWIDRKAEGWAWYEEKEAEPTPIETSQEIMSASDQLSIAKKILEEKLAAAMMNPSEENVSDYMVEQKKWLLQSSTFATIWGKVLLQNPELDPTISHPVSQYGIKLRNEIDNEQKRELINALSKNHGLFFFYEGNSKVSQSVARVIKHFGEKHDWEVIGVSVDGTILENLTNSRLDNGMAKHMGITIYPALFVVNPLEKTSTPVGYGFVSLDQIEEKIMLQFAGEKTNE